MQPVPSPANTSRPVEYAGFWRRFIAWCIDAILIGMVSFIVVIPILGLVGIGIGISAATDEPEAAVGFILAAIGAYIFSIFVLEIAGWLYFAIMESSEKMGTLGKLAMGIIVTDTDGKRISFGRATGRYFAKILSGMIFAIGYIMAGFTQRKQALHDILASCLVVMK